MDVIVKYPDECPVVRGLRRRRLVVFMAAGLSQGCRIAMAAPAPSPEPAPGPQIVEFSASFLGTDAGEVDLTRFERGNPVLPGSYRVDLYVNEFRLSREDVRFVADDPQAPARPCFTRSMLDAANVDLDKLAAEGARPDGDCIDVSMAIPGATTQFDVATLRLDVSIPQVYMRRHARGYVDPALWA